jgi:putative heme-binding domain-containing protein
MKRPLPRRILLERLARALAARGTAEDFANAAKLLENANGVAETGPILAGLELGLAGRALPEIPGPLRPALEALWKRAEPDVTLIRLAARHGFAEAMGAALDRAGDPKRPAAEQSALLELIGQLAPEAGLPRLLDWLDDPGRQGMRGPLLNAIGGYHAPEVATRLIAAYPKLPAAERDQVLGLLASRPSWAGQLLDAMSRNIIKPTELRPAQVVQIAQLGDAPLTARVEALWGRVPGTGSAEKVRRIAEVRGFLPEGDKGDPKRGLPVFKEHCAVCHKLFGEGESIGPDLTGAERGSLDFLLTSLVDPSALIRKEYEAQAVALDDGRVLTGLLVEESPGSVTLIDANRQKTVVARDRIAAMKASPVSLMPEGLLDKIPEDRVRDLFRYIQSAGPPR